MLELDVSRTFRVLLGRLETRASSCVEDPLALFPGPTARFFILNDWGGIRDDLGEVRELGVLPFCFDKLGPLTFCADKAPEPDGLVPLPLWGPAEMDGCIG